MKLKEYIVEKELLASKYGLEKEAIKMIICNIFYQDMTEMISAYDNDIIEKEYDNYINQYLIKRKPAQYIVGFTYFWGCKIEVNSDVLIPRSETELLVEEALKIITTKGYKSIMDLATGSGAIAISIASSLLKKNLMTDFKLLATDISIKALEIAKNNAIINNVNIQFVESDLFSNPIIKLNSPYDIIISNPPYIDYNDVNEVQQIVLNNEPHLALFASDDGLYFYKQIINASQSYLAKNGTIIFEIGYKQANKIKEYVNKLYPFAIPKVIKDYNGLDRIFIIEFNR